MDLKGSQKVSSVIRPWFSVKFLFEWTFYGKLVFKRCLDVEDWFRDKVAVQNKIPFQMNFLRTATTLTAKRLHFTSIQQIRD